MPPWSTQTPGGEAIAYVLSPREKFFAAAIISPAASARLWPGVQMVFYQTKNQFAPPLPGKLVA